MTTRDLHGLPPHAPGLRIGLFGGSFNPIHEGHRLVAEQCLKRLALDAVWLLVSPGNPLKDHSELAPLEQRLQAAEALTAHPRIRVTGIEAQLGTSFTVETLEWLVASCPGVDFVWIMGSDNLGQFHLWERWHDIAALLPIAVYARPGSSMRSLAARAAVSLGRHRLAEAEAETLAGRDPPAWVYLHGVMSPESSSAIRAARAHDAN